MIRELRIENVAILEEACLELGPGLNVLTGETGAGKSIVLGALALLAGGRGGAGTLREGASAAVVEAVFETGGRPELERELERRELREPEEAAAGEVLVRRTVSASGRSRARVGGEPVAVSALAELFGPGIEISSQHSSQSLLRGETHGRWLDEAGGHWPLRERVESGVARLRAIDAELASLRGDEDERTRRADFLSFQIGEIDEVGLGEGELAELDGEHRRLAHAGRLREESAAAALALSGGEAGDEGAVDRTARALRWLDGLEETDPALGPLVERLRGLDAELRELARELERYADGIEADPARLEQLEARLAEVERLRRKYGADEAEIRASRERFAAELAGLEGADDRIAGLEAERRSVEEALRKSAAKLSRARRKAAGHLAGEVERGLSELAMPGARFEVALEPAAPADGLPCGPTGAEVPEFRFSANAGEPLHPLRKVASGGELSRVFLALRNALRASGGGGTLVFDEVDAGIGGRAAERVGRALAELAVHHQVLCITHLPQIAAFAEVHLRVEKQEEGGRTRARVERIAGDERIEEIARMAGGESVTEATRHHARELLESKAASGP